MSRIVRVVASVLLSSVVSTPARPESSAPEAALRALQVVTAARRALGGEEALAAVRSISLEGQLRRQMPGPGGDMGEMSGSVRVDALPPDRFLRVDTVSPMPGMPGLPVATALDGEEAWSGPLPVASMPNVVIRTPPPGDAPAQARLRDRVQREAALFLVSLLVGGGAEYAWVAEAEAPEGKADVLQVTGRGGLDARLFVDQKTHRPLMLTFRDAPPRMMMRRVAGPGGDRHRSGPESAEAMPTPPPPAEATLFLSDWKQVDGVLLPHTLNKTLDGRPYEEIVVSRYLVNDPKLTADKFRKKV
jgi:hypothetical protein